MERGPRYVTLEEETITTEIYSLKTRLYRVSNKNSM